MKDKQAVNKFLRDRVEAKRHKQGLVNVPEGKEAEGLARLEETARTMGGRPLSAFESVRNW